MTKQPKTCRNCPRPSLPGLSQPVCSYHWNLGNWGKEWADRAEAEKRQTAIPQGTQGEESVLTPRRQPSPRVTKDAKVAQKNSR